MKATIIIGSPRGKKGASSRVAQHFAEGLRHANVEVDEIVLRDHKIEHCTGCYTCWTRTPGQCIHRDDMERLLPQIRSADLLVFATPLYTYSVPGLVKDFLDRRLPSLQPFLVKRGEVTAHPGRDKNRSADMFLISVAGFPERSHFDPLVAMFQKFYPTGTDSQLLGQILIGGSEPMSRDQLQGAYTELYALIEQAGCEVGEKRKMSPETEQAILEMTTYSPERIAEFRETANAYWESLIPKDQEPQPEINVVSDKELKLSDGGIATFLAGMALQYNPKAMPGFVGVIQFKFERETYHLLVKNDQCKAYKGEHPHPNLTILTPQQVWLDISDGNLDGTKAYMDGQYRTEGDMNLLMKFDQLFGAEPDNAAASDSSESDLKMSSQHSHDNIPEHRGPIKLPAMMWLTVAFLPWMLLWIADSFIPAPLPNYVAAGVAVLIAGYHLFTNVVTLFETGTAIYLVLSSILTITGWAFFQQFGEVINYLFLSGLWFGSVPRRFALTAEYSRYLFPKVIWNQPSFKETNMIICAAWGGYFLVAAILALMTASGFGGTMIEIARYLLLVPMFIFTDRFQKWYPAKMMQASA